MTTSSPKLRRWHRLVPTVAMALFLAIGGALLVALDFQRQRLVGDATADAAILADHTVEMASAQLIVGDAAVYDAVTLATRLFQDDGYAATELTVDLTHRVAGMPGVIAMAVYDPLGSVVATAGARMPEDPQWAGKQLRRLRDDWVDPDFQVVEGHLISISRGIWSDGGAFLGYASALINFDKLLEELTVNPSAAQGRLTLRLRDQAPLFDLVGALVDDGDRPHWLDVDTAGDSPAEGTNAVVSPGGANGRELAVAVRQGRDLPVRAIAQIAVAPYLDGWRSMVIGTALAMGVLGVVLIAFLAILRQSERQRTRSLKDLALSEERLAFALENARLGLWDWNTRSGAVYYSPRLLATLGYGPDDWPPTLQPFLDHLHPEDRSKVMAVTQAPAWQAEAEGETELRMRKADGTWLWISNVAKVLETDSEGRVVRIVGSAQDITTRKGRELTLELAATIDPLLGIRNRRSFETTATAAVARARRDAAPLSVVMIDLDHFKAINDRYGHDGGDEALKVLCRTLQTTLRESELDKLFRLGGEEFVVLLEGTNEIDGLHAAERLRAGVQAASVRYNGELFTMTASFGISSLYAEERSLGEALRRADAALYTAKERGRNRVCRYDTPSRPQLTVVSP